MKKCTNALILLALLLTWGSTKALAQDFKLYFANNVNDIVDFTKIEDESSPLAWREVKNGDISGNLVETSEVRNMFASTEMKKRAQQRQFWTMRDHCLLCFRINDGKGTTGSYTVEVDDGTGKGTQTLTVSRFFYVNAPRQGEDVKIRVYRVDDVEKKNGFAFKYTVYDWDDNNLYIFQLDSKRQLTKETYRLQYVLGHTDEEGSFQTDTTTLALRDSSFQSFYVKEGFDLLDVFLISGDPQNPQEEHKLKLNKARLHTGVTLDPDYSVTRLSPAFLLDKHENRELVNFNWIGPLRALRHPLREAAQQRWRGHQARHLPRGGHQREGRAHPQRPGHEVHRLRPYDEAAQDSHLRTARLHGDRGLGLRAEAFQV